MAVRRHQLVKGKEQYINTCYKMEEEEPKHEQKNVREEQEQEKQEVELEEQKVKRTALI